MIPTEARLLRIYVDAHDRWQGRPLYEAIVARARATDVARGLGLPGRDELRVAPPDP